MSARQDLLLQAQKVFNDFGYRRASMGDMARVAGVSRQGLYHHFPNKPELFAAVIEMVHAGTVAQSGKARDQARERGASFEAVVAAMLDARFGELQRLLMRSRHHNEVLEEVNNHCVPIVAKYAAKFREMMIAAINDEMAAGRLKLAADLTVEELAIAFATIARGVNIRQPPPDPAHLREEYARYLRLVLRGARA